LTQLEKLDADECFAEGMEAAHCDELMKACPYPKNGKKAAEWRKGYLAAYDDRAKYWVANPEVPKSQ
jgi:hypothetical protein